MPLLGARAARFEAIQVEGSRCTTTSTNGVVDVTAAMKEML
jgi:hypothetical protein